jgi:type I restriction enzyme, S subunit
MNAGLLLKHFAKIIEAPEAVPLLRRFILDLAVRGKLVQQDENDEPAEKLLERIKLEKERLLKAGEIRKERESFGLPDQQSLETLPTTWQWTRLATISREIHYGYTASSDKSLTDVRLLRITDIQNSSVDWSTVPGCEISERDVKQYKLEQSDILIARTGGTIGKSYLVTEVPVVAVFASYLIRVKPARELFDQFLKLFLDSSVYWLQLQDGSRGTGQPNVNGQTLGKMLVPLPPLEEQRRIVAKVSELMMLCDTLENATKTRETLQDQLSASSLHFINQEKVSPEETQLILAQLPRMTARKTHVKALRQTILNLAVRGKLVPQNETDEPAEKLLEKIKLEKEKLVKEGKQKKEIPLPEIDETQVPFEKPLGWTWARFPELGIFGRGKSKHRPRNDSALFENGTHPMIQTGDVARSNGKIETYTSKYNDFGLAQSKKWSKGTLCITIAANIADSGLLDFDACFPDSVVGFMPNKVFPNAQYFEYFIRTAKANLLEFAPATAQKNINLEILSAVLIPLPPLEEQHRIVTKVSELMTLCDTLETELYNQELGQQQLLEAVLHHALTPMTETG